MTKNSVVQKIKGFAVRKEETLFAANAVFCRFILEEILRKVYKKI